MARNKYDVDEILEDRFDINQLKRLASYLIPYKKPMALVIFLMLSSSALTMLIPQFFMKVLDECIPAKDMRMICLYAGLTLLIAVYSAVTTTRARTGRPQRQIRVSLTLIISMKIRMKIRLHKSVMVLTIPLESRSLRLFT